MARLRRPWSEMQAIIRRILREQDAANSEWQQEDLLDAWNAALDLRSMQMDEQGEGWNVDAFVVDVTAGLHLYTKPEGAERIRRVCMRSGDGKTLIPLVRDDRLGQAIALESHGVVSTDGMVPRWRPRGEFLLIEPPFTADFEDGLVVEADSAPTHFTGADDDKLDLRFPVRMEWLLIYDTVAFALGVEDQLGNTQGDEPSGRSRFQMIHAQYETWWMGYVSDISSDAVFARPGAWGA